ncbi:MAG: iron-sulfur cluster assembly accessory protein [Enhygromyxa sp.]
MSQTSPTTPTPAASSEQRPKLTVTTAAAEVMRAQLDKRGTPNAAIRFGIRGGGCTGYSYVFEFSDKPPRKNDHVIEAELGVRLFVDPKSMIYLEGTNIHFERGIRGHGFQFDNPNVKSDCGCGESVSF